jgi:hypothetical protein
MLILAIGAKGGVGTTSLALALVKAGHGVAVDLADGQLAARLGRKTWTMKRLVFMLNGRRQRAIEAIVEKRPTLLWSPECSLKPEGVVDLARGAADRLPVVVDGGIDYPNVAVPQPPLDDLADVADRVIIVTKESSNVASYHEERLKRRFPGADSLVYHRETTEKLIEQLF